MPKTTNKKPKQAKKYKLHRIENGYSVRAKDRDVDIQIFKGSGCMNRAVAFKNELEANHAE